MFCKDCGAENADNARFCRNCGRPLRAEKVQGVQKTTAHVTTAAAEKRFDAKRFLLPQIVIIEAVAALIYLDMFTDESGGISIIHTLAVVLLLALLEVILFNISYVRVKSNAAKTAAGEQRYADVRSAVQQPMQPPVQPQLAASEVMVQQASPADFPESPLADAYSDEKADDDFYEDETELWDDGQSGMDAWLEYYENDQLNKIMLNKPSTLIGRLKGQVDFTVMNPRVGKIHAEFLNQEGRIYVKDLNSKNGTYINGDAQRIDSSVPYPLNDQDRVRLADSEFVLCCAE